MKKLALAVVALFFVAFSLNAQHVFDKGDLGINAGIGFGSYGGFFPAIEVSGEYGAIPTGDIGLVSFGGLIGYKYSSYDYYFLTDYSYNYHQFEIGVRAAWHLHSFKSDKFDVYAGLGLGMHIDSYYEWDLDKGEPVRKPDPGLYEEVFVGGRMMFKPKFGIFAEVGYSKLSAVRFGLTFKM